MNEQDPAWVAQRAAAVARASLIIAFVAIAVAILGLFLPVQTG